jgi:hypothetical protein
MTVRAIPGALDTRETPFQWIGVDLDGTLAHYDGWKGPQHIGPPVRRMARRVREWLAEGKRVKIMTARATPNRQTLAEYDEVIAAIEAWCLRHLGQVLEITNAKDFGMIELWDDRAVQVIPNTGRRADGRE